MDSVSPVTRQVDALMHKLYQRSKGAFTQTLFASYDIADRYRHLLQPEYAVSNRGITRLTDYSWRMQRWLGFSLALQLCFLAWAFVGMALLIRKSLYLHRDTFNEHNGLDATIWLLRTGVSNEPNIAAWLSTKHGGKPVGMLSINESAAFKPSAIRHLPALVRIYWIALGDLKRRILQLNADGELNPEMARALPPVWLYLVARRLPLMCQWHAWAERCIPRRGVTHLYFTMNSILENAFINALPDIEHAYVEHGFPRRDIPPLPCKQYVYGERYATYLQAFDQELTVEQIGIDYFPKADIGPKEKTIVVASLQDWPQWGIANVAERFNAALKQAKEQGWRLIFRGRNYDQDAFAQALVCEWDEISTPKQESFAECLQRLKPAMVWTTWSTAVLDAQAMGIASVCFVDNLLLDYFIPDVCKAAVEVQDKIEQLDYFLCGERND